MITGLLLLFVAAITLFAFRADYRHYQNRLRSGMILISGIFLAGFLTEPNWWPASDEHYILFTGDVNTDELRGYAPGSVFFLSDQDNMPSGRGSYIASAAYLPDFIPEGSKVKVRGEGTYHQLPSGFRWINELSEPSSGIHLEEAPNRIETGQLFRITGKLVGYMPADTLTIFRDGSALDFSEPDDEGRFVLADVVHSAGPVQYQFEWTGTDTTITEPLNLRAVEPQQLRIAALLYSPSFEINYLSELFGSRGHAMALRTRIGDERFRFDDLNDPPAPAEEMIDNVGKFDLLILDAREFAELDAEQQNSVKDALEMGADLLLIPPREPVTETWTEVIEMLTGQQIGLRSIDRLEQRQWLPEIAESEGRVLPRIPLLDLNFENLPDQSEIVYHFEDEFPVAVRIPAGNGSVSAHLFHQTYRLLLRGEKELYNQFWADYFDRIITIESHFLEIPEKISSLNRPVTIITSHDHISVRPGTENEQFQLSVAYGIDHPASGYALYWPEETGWHRAEAGEITRWFYVYDDEWDFSRSYENYLETSRQISAHQDWQEDTGSSQRKSVPGWIWLIGFFLLQAFLWIERKLI